MSGMQMNTLPAMRDIPKVAIVVVWLTHSGETASLVFEADGASALGLKPETANVVTAYARLTCTSQMIQQPAIYTRTFHDQQKYTVLKNQVPLFPSLLTSPATKRAWAPTDQFRIEDP